MRRRPDGVSSAQARSARYRSRHQCVTTANWVRSHGRPVRLGGRYGRLYPGSAGQRAVSTWAADSALTRAHSNWRSVARRAPHYLAVLAGSLSLSAIVGLSLLIVMAAAERHSFLSPTSRAGFPHWMSGPLAGHMPGLSHKSTATDRVQRRGPAMFLLYLVVLATHRALPAWTVVAAIGPVHLVFFLSPPLPLTDIFNYLNYARMGALSRPQPIRRPAGRGSPRPGLP